MQESNERQMSVWASLWIHPRLSLRRILEKDPCGKVLMLAMINGLISALLWRYMIIAASDEKTLLGSPLIAIAFAIGGALLGAFYLYFGGWLYRLTGSWLGGKGSFIDVKCAMGWSYYPFTIASLLYFPHLLLKFNPLGHLLSTSLFVIASIWAFVLWLELLGEAHRFSALKSLATLLISALLVFSVIFILLLLIPLIYWMLT